MSTIAPALREPLCDLLLSIADDKFMLGSRNSDWTGLAPILEEDIAFSAMAQDEIGHAGALYDFIAGLRGAGATADRIAYGRQPEEYRCAEITVLADDFDWAAALARKVYCDHFDARRLARLAQSSDAALAALGRRMSAEERVHVEHGDGWIVRLARGSAEAHERLAAAFARLAPAAAMLHEPTARLAEVEQAGLYPPAGDMYATWRAGVAALLGKAGLECGLPPAAPQGAGGRSGRHGADLRALLTEVTEVYRVEPDAAW